MLVVVLFMFERSGLRILEVLEFRFQGLYRF